MNKNQYLEWCIYISLFISWGCQFVHVVFIQGWIETLPYQSVTFTQRANGHAQPIRYNGVCRYIEVACVAGGIVWVRD